MKEQIEMMRNALINCQPGELFSEKEIHKALEVLLELEKSIDSKNTEG